IVLNQEKRASQALEMLDMPYQLLHEGRIYPGPWLIKQDTGGVRHHRTRQLQQFFLTAGEIAGVLVAQVMEFHALQNLLSTLVQGLFLGVDLAWMQPGIEEVFTPLLLWHEEEILQHRHALERTGDLECADNPARKNVVGWESIDPFSLKPYAPSIR